MVFSIVFFLFIINKAGKLLQYSKLNYWQCNFQRLFIRVKKIKGPVLYLFSDVVISPCIPGEFFRSLETGSKTSALPFDLSHA